MAAKRKAAPKRANTPPKRGTKKSGRGRKALTFILVAGLLGLAVWGALKFTRQGAEVPVAATATLQVGGKGKGDGQMDSPRGLAVAPNGDVYICDLVNGRIAVFGGDGSFIRNFGKLGPEPGKGKAGEFNEPSGVAVGPDGTVYVADAWNGRVQKFDAKGKFLGELGGAKYAFYSPRNVAVDRMGNLYVADTGNSMIKVISPDGKMAKTMGGKGQGDGQFGEVFGLAVSSQGEVYVADPGNRKIHKFSALPAGDFVASVKVPGWAVNAPFWPQLAVDKKGIVYAMDPAGRKIWVYDSQLQYRCTVGAPSGLDFLSSPMGLGVDASGNLWISDTATNKLVHLGPIEIPAGKP